MVDSLMGLWEGLLRTNQKATLLAWAFAPAFLPIHFPCEERQLDIQRKGGKVVIFCETLGTGL